MGVGQWQRKEPRTWRLQQRDGGSFRRPPPSPGSSFDSVPKWERRFCSQMSWRDFCDKKRAMHLYPKVLNWDDLAGKEAFDGAKARCWAEINGLPCEIPLPDPDMYIDEIDHDSPIDPWLIEDLYRTPPPPPYREPPDIGSIKPTGWDVVDPSPSGNIPEYILATTDDVADNSAPSYRTGIVPTGWGDEEETNNAKALRERESNDDFSTNRGTSEDHQHGGWEQDWRHDDMIASEKVRSWEHRCDGRRSSGSNCKLRRCDEQGYEMDIWRKYAKEQDFWLQSSLSRGLSCASQNF